MANITPIKRKKHAVNAAVAVMGRAHSAEAKEIAAVVDSLFIEDRKFIRDLVFRIAADARSSSRVGRKGPSESRNRLSAI